MVAPTLLLLLQRPPILSMERQQRTAATVGLMERMQRQKRVLVVRQRLKPRLLALAKGILLRRKDHVAYRTNVRFYRWLWKEINKKGIT